MVENRLHARDVLGATFRPWLGRARRAGRFALDLLLPPVCFVCERPLADRPGLCMDCWSRLDLIERPFCARYGTPLAYDLGPEGLSAQAIADPPPFARARAVCVHGDISRRLVHGFKYADRLDFAPVMATWMVRAGADLLADAQVIVPVPLHRGRLWQRRYNQAAVLAQQVGARCGVPVDLRSLARHRPTQHQVGLDQKARQANVRGAFRLVPGADAAFHGRRVLLIDDVYTTGATVRACTRALLRGRAASVDVLTFARVVLQPNSTI